MLVMERFGSVIKGKGLGWLCEIVHRILPSSIVTVQRELHNMGKLPSVTVQMRCS